MIVVDVNSERGIESALKTFKLKVQKSGMIQELKQRTEFVKPSTKRRQQKNKAKYIQKIKDQQFD